MSENINNWDLIDQVEWIDEWGELDSIDNYAAALVIELEKKRKKIGNTFE